MFLNVEVLGQPRKLRKGSKNSFNFFLICSVKKL